MQVQWFRNPRAKTAHAYSVGPGQGDSSLCGRTLHTGKDRQPYENEPLCYYCTGVIRESEAQAA